MKKYVYYTALWLCALASACGQGVFIGDNSTAPTRVGSVDGPLAGTNIIGQMFGGAGASSLQPVGPIDYHNNGIFSVPYITVPDVPPRALAYVQLVTWDSTLLGDQPFRSPARSAWSHRFGHGFPYYGSVSRYHLRPTIHTGGRCAPDPRAVGSKAWRHGLCTTGVPASACERSVKGMAF